ncbi:hypothetical protein BHE74_00013080 [Ensete ventricosum]|nr:hypothetical protein BHE74_00013080 [Ensete ventricosum]
MHTARYWAVSPIGAVTAPLPPEIDRYRSILTVIGHCRVVTIDFERRRYQLREGERRRGRRKTWSPAMLLARAIRCPRAIYSPRARRRNVSPCGEKERGNINSLTGTNVEWLYHILHAFNTGNLLRYQELCRVHNIALRAQPALVENEKKLLEKINILCLMEIISRTVAPYDDDLLIVSARWYQVKNVHLIEGIIDQVEGTVHVSWVQPMVLGIPQIRSLRGRLDTWVGKVRAALLSVEAETPDLVACA